MHITEKKFAERIRSCVRLFLSVDLVGSTRLKQQSKDSPTEWLSEVLFFLTDFNTTLTARIQESVRNTGKKRIKPPKLWKALGDELVFVADISKAHELATYIEAFQKALQIWNSKVVSTEFMGNLPLKGAAWIAGFPVGNTVIDIPNRTLDFAGPSIDAGFRVASQATKRRLMISVEIAWFLLKLKAPFKINYSGPVLLKGLSDDIGYPALWIEVGDSKYLKQDRKLSGLEQDSSGEIALELCERYILEFGVPNHLPFLEKDADFSARPKDYAAMLEIKIEQLRKIHLPDGASGTKTDSKKLRQMVDGVTPVATMRRRKP